MSSTDIDEKGTKPYVSDGDLSDEPELPPNLQSVAHRGFLGTLRHYENLLDKKIGVEAHGPARILPEQRDPEFGKWNKQIVMALMWASGTMNLSCFTTGFLGWELGLSLSQTIWITIVASFVGSAITVRSSLASRQPKENFLIPILGLVCNSGTRDRTSTSEHQPLRHGLVAGQDHRLFERR
jgi:hypothetical protein